MGIREIPKSIQDHKYYWLFGKEWLQIHNRTEGNSFNFFIGGNGTGKTYASLTRSEIVGVDENDSYGKLFDADHLENHLFFDKQDMQNKIVELEKRSLKDRRGYQLILDEAQMSANAKQWNDREVLNFSKDMTTIRSSRLSISLTMPTHRMITTDLRQLGTYQVEMLPSETMNLEKGISYSKLHFLTLRPHEGEVWRKRPLIVSQIYNPIMDLPLSKKGLMNEISWKLPSKTTRRNYERLKREFRKLNAEKLATQKEVEIKPKKTDLEEILIEARKIKHKLGDGRRMFMLSKIREELCCGVSMAYQVKRELKREEDLMQYG